MRIVIDEDRSEGLSLGDVLYLHDVDGKRLAGIIIEEIKMMKTPVGKTGMVEIKGEHLSVDEIEAGDDG